MKVDATLVLLRHGQSQWNAENRFTGWFDSDLSQKGEHEAREAGRLLKEEGIVPAILHTSLQSRAIRTANLALEVMGLLWIPVKRHWRLNERHYGDLEGRNKKETSDRHGLDQVQVWRRSYDVPPPALDPDDERHPAHQPTYRHLPADILPATECLKDVVDRMMPYWYDSIVPDLQAGRAVFVSAHGNSLRALVKKLKRISDEDIPGLEIPTGVPWVFDLGDDLEPVGDRLLGDEEAIREQAEAVARQAG